MRVIKKSEKTVISALLIVALMLCAVAGSSVFSAEDTGQLAEEAANNYYLWGLNTNDPEFGAMTSPTGSFSYDGVKGYYYYDLHGASGDYCFVVSTVNNSGATAQRSPAVGGVAESGNYYLQQGNYRGYACMHLWNPAGDDVRIYFKSTGSGLYAVPLSSVDTTPTTAPTQKPTTAPTTKPTSPTVKPTSSNPTTKPTAAPTSAPPTTAPGGSKVIYCENEAGWGAVYAYLWNGSGETKNAEWPGVKMSYLGDNVWSYTVPKTFEKIIFNIGSSTTQTKDMAFPGYGYIYNNKTESWSIYDTSPLQVQSFTTDLKSPQYAGVGITLSARATGNGTVKYKFSAKSSSGSTKVIADYSTKSTALWTPAAAGTYTLIFDFKDAAGNTNQRTVSYKVDDGSKSEAPFIKTVSPASGQQIKKSSACKITVSAGGGNVNTKLLFYKYTVKDSSGKTVNVPYYTRNTSYSFTPSALGKYTVTVSVQGSDNTTVERDYIYESVTKVVTPVEPTDPPEQSDPTVAPTQPPSSGTLKGDADSDGKVTILDATRIQRWLASLVGDNMLNKANADCDGDGKVAILDATRIQRLLAGLISKL